MENMLLIPSDNLKLLDSKQYLGKFTSYMEFSDITKHLRKGMKSRDAKRVLKLIKNLSYKCDSFCFSINEGTIFDSFLIGYLYSTFVTRKVILYDKYGNLTLPQLKRLYINAEYSTEGSVVIVPYITPTDKININGKGKIEITPVYKSDFVLLGKLYSDRKLRRRLKVNWVNYDPSIVMKALFPKE